MGTSKVRESVFRFKQFAVANALSGMKVGTDGVMLGAWAEAPCRTGPVRMLDVGSGCGLIALMLAQRFPAASIVGVEIDEEACREARVNVAGSPWPDRVSIVCADFADYARRAVAAGEAYDAVVSNPPFFASELQASDRSRRIARHGLGLDYAAIIRGCAAGLLAPGGVLSLVSPTDRQADILRELELASLSLVRLTRVRTRPAAPAPSRLLWAISHTSPSVSSPLLSDLTIGSPDYLALTSPFYL